MSALVLEWGRVALSKKSTQLSYKILFFQLVIENAGLCFIFEPNANKVKMPRMLY